jgi:hypothetical protein
MCDIWRALRARQRPMAGLGVSELTALAFVDTMTTSECFFRSCDSRAYLSLLAQRFQSREIDYVDSILKFGNRRVRALLCDAGSVMLIHCRGVLGLTSATTSPLVLIIQPRQGVYLMRTHQVALRGH